MSLTTTTPSISSSFKVKYNTWEVVVAQLVEQSLSIPEVSGSTPVISKIYIEHLFVNFCIINCIEKTKIKKRPVMAHLFKNIIPRCLSNVE